jgi:hypothetical protein
MHGAGKEFRQTAELNWRPSKTWIKVKNPKAHASAFDARRQRIIISQSQVNLVKWLCLFVQAAAALFAIAMIHCDNRIASAITVGLFATGVAASVLLIAAHDRPFTGEISVGPGPLLQVMPDASR